LTTQLIRGLYNLTPSARGSVVTIGNFDGVHRGHQALLARTRQAAVERNLESVAITFEPQPAEFFSRGKPAIARLTRCREKFIALRESGIDKVLVLRFDEKLAALSAHEFIQQVLCQGLHAAMVIVGDDFRFGHKREGDFTFLKTAGEAAGFSAESMPSVMVDGSRASSTRVRHALQQGNLALAKELLGRPFTLEGRVCHGDKLGRTLGFPTANLNLYRQIQPLSGIYAVRIHGLHTALTGVASIGTRPTVNGKYPLLETNIFNLDENIYGRHIKIEFCVKLREEAHFTDLQALTSQMSRDADQARKYFTHQTTAEGFYG
jgi:riboflavin kinase/FMN adenylyltransferase